MKKFILLILVTTIFATCYGQTSRVPVAGSFQATLKYMENLLIIGIAKKQFEELLPPSSRFLKSKRLGNYNPSTDKHDRYTHCYYYYSEYRKTKIEVSIEAAEEYMPITKIEVVVEGTYWNGQIKEGEIISDIYAQAAEGDFISKNAFQFGNGMKEFMSNDKVTVDLFQNLVDARVVYGMWKN